MAAIAYEDLTPGRDFDLGTTEIDRDEMVDFARRFDPQPFHIDEEAGKNSLLGGLCASGWYTSALWMRAYVDHVVSDSTSQGSPGGSDLSWTAPVYPGDTLRFHLLINDRRLSRSKPGLGLVDGTGTVTRENTTNDGNGERVLSFNFMSMFHTREQPDD